MNEQLQSRTANEAVKRLGSTMYNKEALDRFHKQNYVDSLNGHSEFISANTLRNSIRSVNIATGAERFKVQKTGGHYATTGPVKSSFEKKVSHL